MLEFAEELETEQIYQWEEDERYYDLIAARKVEDSLRETERSLLVTPNWEGDDVKEEQAAADEINEQDEASRLWAIRIAAMQQELEEEQMQEGTESDHIGDHRESFSEKNDNQYHEVLDSEFLKRPYRILQHDTHREMLMTLHNLVQGIKKSAKIARAETTSEMKDVKELSEVHEFNVRSQSGGGAVQLVRSYAPKSFSRIRTVLGLGYESFARTLDDTEVFFQSGHFFFSNRSSLLFQMIDEETVKLILSLTKSYSDYVHHNALTILPHWYGLFRVSRSGMKTFYFLLTSNIFYTVDKIDVLYDIRGVADTSLNFEHRCGHHYVFPLGTREDCDAIKDVWKVAVDQHKDKLFDDNALLNKMRNSVDLFQSSPLILHPSERAELLETLRRDTLWLDSHQLYDYSILIGAHHCSPFDKHALQNMETGLGNKFGGLSVYEDSFRVQIVGPFRRWTLADNVKGVGASLYSSSSAVQPAAYSRRLRERMFECLLEFDKHINFDHFCMLKTELFKDIIKKSRQKHLPAERKVKKTGSLMRAAKAMSRIGSLFSGKQQTMRKAKDGQTQEQEQEQQEDPPAHRRLSRKMVRLSLKGEEGMEGESMSKPRVSLGDLKPGLGLMLGTSKDGRVMVTNCLPGRSAYRSGKIMKGDLLTWVGRPGEDEWSWTDVSRKTSTEVAALLVGKEGDIICLRLRRTAEDGQVKGVDFEVILEFLPSENVLHFRKNRTQEEKALAMTEIAGHLLKALQSRQPDDTDPLIYGAALPVLENLDELWEDPEDGKVHSIEELVERCVEGSYLLYRSAELPREDEDFLPVGVVYNMNGVAVQNLVHVVNVGEGAARGREVWLNVRNWITINRAPWMTSPDRLKENNEIFPSFVQLVEALDELKKLIDLSDPPLKKIEVVKTLYDVWMEKQGKKHAQKLHRDHDRLVPIHPRARNIRQEDKTNIDLSGAVLSGIVKPNEVLNHMSAYYPIEMGKVIDKIATTLHQDISVFTMQEAVAELLQKKGLTEVKSDLFMLKSGTTGEKVDDWRKRMFVMRENFLCFNSEKQEGVLKRVADIKGVTDCEVKTMGPFSFGIILYRVNEGIVEFVIKIATDDESDFRMWLMSMATVSEAVSRAYLRAFPAEDIQM
ncbi:hypothetical protein GUITHDRAFT_108444 [Guillardia theta CCMP2712]|uniref:PDZ domain-containing protein n=1 Tax=Guillardia theta (strain CCMP2712) TaxID=905079 RepID=L1JAL4_GUITC|nr:hypothetical protein GUITHDRAFT_108444 [Guillardia theta CCMP2712]EKX45571.1 hypothetical protein GUITHDRAFT_108444 [Guillardia theta CCMP2712]|eukprot:XP_005832551.1 hypothetical protein GUITHDRAFT_108444 [Guillardia theta CCMP2712]